MASFFLRTSAASVKPSICGIWISDIIRSNSDLARVCRAFRPDETAEYGYMVDVFDELRQAEDKIGLEVKNVSIPTQREVEMFWY